MSHDNGVSSAPSSITIKESTAHPLAPLSAQEISTAADLVRGQWPEKTNVHFKVITLKEPPKAEVIPLLEAEHHGQTFAPLARKAFICYYLRNTVS